MSTLGCIFIKYAACKQFCSDILVDAVLSRYSTQDECSRTPWVFNLKNSLQTQLFSFQMTENFSRKVDINILKYFLKYHSENIYKTTLY